MASARGAPLVSDAEVEIVAIRAQGAGGQNVNKVANAVHLRFDVGASSLPDDVKVRLLALGDRRVSTDGIVVIKAQRYRSLEQNRLRARGHRARHATRPTAGSRRRRVEAKVKRGQVKALRGRVTD